MSIWGFNLPIKQHNLIGVEEEEALLNDQWEGEGGMRGCCRTAS
jgi:hypothetical protein